MLVQWIAKILGHQQDLDFSLDHPALRHLIERAEGVKITLTTQQAADIRIGPWRKKNGESFHRQIRVSRPQMDELIAPVVAQTMSFSQKAIEGAGLQAEDIAEILLVGKASYTPLVVKEVIRMFNRPINHAGPDAVACGAALHAASLQNCFVPRAGHHLPARSVISEPIPEKKEDLTAKLPEQESEDSLLAAVRKVRHILKTNDLEAGIEAFESLLNHAREELSYLYSKRASQLRQEGRLDEAQAKLEVGFKCWPENMHIRRLLAGMHAEKAGRFALGQLRGQLLARCKKHLRQCLQLDPENISAKQLKKELEIDFGRKGKRRKRKR